MFETILDEEERGQVGIGTLIVFIAMVLVAAIAAGVLINTAGFLQTQAEATGEESTAQVSDRLQVVSTSGNVTGSQNVDTLRFVVALSPGSSAIDLEQTTIQFIGEQGEATDSGADLVNSGSGGTGITDIQGLSGNVLTDNSDRAEVAIEFSTGTSTSIEDTYSALSEDESLTVVFTTSSGASTEKEIRIPTTLTSEDSSVRL
jgi:flagellin-like protein